MLSKQSGKCYIFSKHFTKNTKRSVKCLNGPSHPFINLSRSESCAPLPHVLIFCQIALISPNRSDACPPSLPISDPESLLSLLRPFFARPSGSVFFLQKKPSDRRQRRKPRCRQAPLRKTVLLCHAVSSRHSSVCPPLINFPFFWSPHVSTAERDPPQPVPIAASRQPYLSLLLRSVQCAPLHSEWPCLHRSVNRQSLGRR